MEQYNKRAQEVKDLGAEIERLEQQAQIEAQLSAPTSSPVHADPKSGAKKDVKPTATAEYAENFWNMIRNRGHYGEVRNALSVGEDTEGGFTVPDEFEKKLVEALEENNIFRGMATVIRTSSGTRKIPIAEDTGEASWFDEGEEIPESDTTFGQTIIMNWSIDRRFSRGLFLTPALLGYDQDEDGSLVVNQNEAQTVKVIYYLYLNGFSFTEIAELLTEYGRKTKLGDTEWNPGTLAGVIANERHCGDVLARKTFTPNFLTHKSKKNNNDRTQYRQRDHHEAIVSREVYTL